MHASAERNLTEADPEIAKLIAEENVREHETMRLIASENYASRAVMEATGSCLTNKYSEGYAHKRYYEGQQVIDQVEELAIARLKRLFDPGGTGLHVNVQPYSGSPAMGASEVGRASVVVVVQSGERQVGLLVDAVCDILRVTEGLIQSPPDLGDGCRQDFISGVMTTDHGIIGLLSLQHIVPADDADAAAA